MGIWTAAQTPKTNGGRGRGKNSNGQNSHGIKKLRELILELAVRGKLVPQDPNDEPASVLLEKIAKKKKRLIKEGKVKKQKPLPAIQEDEKPFELPQGWAWVRLPEISTYKPGKTPSTKNPIYWSEDANGIPWVSISDMEHFGWINDTNKKVTQEAADNIFRYEVIPAGTLLMSFKLTVGKISILKVDAYHNEAIISIEPFKGMCKGYLFKFLPNRAESGKTKKAIKGRTLNSKSLALLLVPVPPVAEQHRIVAKVDELMALCDRLEQQQTDSNDTHQTLVENLLAPLTQAADQRECAKAWQRIADHFDSLFTTEQSIDQLKQTLLQLAIMGKLVPQDPNDQPAGTLLKKIAKEKKRLIKEGKIKKQKPLPEIGEDEKPFELPERWEWVRFGNVGGILGGGTPNKSTSAFWDGEIPWISPKDMKVDYISDSLDKITTEAVEKSSAKIIPANSLLIVVRGMILSHSFPTAINLVPVTINQDMKAVVLNGYERSFILLMIKGLKNEFVDMVEHSTHGTCKIVSDKLWNKVLAIPPAPEQRRIIAKVDKLMALCDKLKARLNETQNTQLQLADAIVEKAVA